MRRWILGVLIVMMLLLTTISVLAGYQIESRLPDQLNRLDERLESVQFEGLVIDRGWFSTRVQWSVFGMPDGMANAALTVTHGLKAMLSGNWVSIKGQFVNADDPSLFDSELTGGLGMLLRSHLQLEIGSDSLSGRLMASAPWGMKQGLVELDDLRLRDTGNLAIDGLDARLQFDHQQATEIDLVMTAERLAFVRGSGQVITESTLNISSSSLNKRADLKLMASAASWQQGSSRLDAVRYQSSTSQINLPTLKTLIDALMELNQQGYPADVIRQQLGTYLFLAIPELLRVQPSHQLAELSWTQAEGAIRMQGHIELTSEPQGAFISEPQRLLAVLEADGTVDAPAPVIRGWMNRYYRAQAPEMTDVERQYLIEYQLGQYQLLDEDNGVRARFQFTDEQLRINSRPVVPEQGADSLPAPG